MAHCQVWKYPVPVRQGEFSLRIASDAKPLSVQFQHGQPVMWVVTDMDRLTDRVERRFIWYGTGWDIMGYENLEYVGTMQDGWLVWHLFEVVRSSESGGTS